MLLSIMQIETLTISQGIFQSNFLRRITTDITVI